MITVMVAELLTFAYTIWFLVSECKQFKKEGKKYFKVETGKFLVYWLCRYYLFFAHEFNGNIMFVF